VAAAKHKRALGYARVSSVAQVAGSSLGDQQEAIRSHAQTRGLTLARIYVEAESGIREKFEKREQLLALLDEVRAGDLVLVHRLDRWSRDPEVTYRTVRQLLEAGASFYSIDDQCDPSTSEGDTMLNFRVLFAREEHKRIKARMIGTRRLLRDRGLWVEGVVPFGYARPTGVDRRSRNTLVVVPDQAETVREIYALAIAGQPMARIASDLGLTRDRVFDVLQRRFYLGELEDSNGDWIKGQHPPIIDRATYARARAAIEARRLSNRPARSPDAETATWILRDVSRCAKCDAKMVAAYAGPHGPQRRYYYRCYRNCTTRYVNVRNVEAEFGPMVVGRLAELREVLSQDGPLKRGEPKAVDFDAARAKLAQKRARYLEMYADGTTTKEDMRASVDAVDAEMARLEDRAAEASRTSPLSIPTVRREVLRDVSALAHAWRIAEPADRRIIVNRLADRVNLEAKKPPAPVWATLEALIAKPREI
jgi:DNA invertase Pin-like site-specific DNA recombinase